MEVGGEIIYVSLHCHHQNDFCIQVGSEERHFNVSLIVRDKVKDIVHKTTTFDEKGEPKQIRTAVPLLTSLTPYPLGQTGSPNSCHQLGYFKPFTARACLISGVKGAHLMPPNSICGGPVTNSLSILCILITNNLFTCSQKGDGKSLNGLKFGIFIIRFPSDGARGKYGNQKVNFAVSTRLTVQLPLASYARPLVRGEQNCYLWGSERNTSVRTSSCEKAVF